MKILKTLESALFGIECDDIPKEAEINIIIKDTEGKEYIVEKYKIIYECGKWRVVTTI